MAPYNRIFIILSFGRCSFIFLKATSFNLTSNNIFAHCTPSHKSMSKRMHELATYTVIIDISVSGRFFIIYAWPTKQKWYSYQRQPQTSLPNKQYESELNQGLKIRFYIHVIKYSTHIYIKIQRYHTCNIEIWNRTEHLLKGHHNEGTSPLQKSLVNAKY